MSITLGAVEDIAYRIAGMQKEADLRKNVGIVFLITSLISAATKVLSGSADSSSIMDKVESVLSSSKMNPNMKVNVNDDKKINEALEAVKEDPSLEKAVDHIKRNGDINVSNTMKELKINIPNVLPTNQNSAPNEAKPQRATPREDGGLEYSKYEPANLLFDVLDINSFSDFQKPNFDPSKTIKILEFISDNYDNQFVTDWIGVTHSDLIDDWTSKDDLDRNIEEYKTMERILNNWKRNGEKSGLNEIQVEGAREGLRLITNLLGNFYAAATNPERFEAHVNGM